MGKDRNVSPPENSDEETGTPSKSKSKSKSESESEDTKPKSHSKSDKGKKQSKSRRRHNRSDSSEEDSYSDSESQSDSDYSESESGYSDSEEERRRRKRKRREREGKERKKRRKEKEKKRRRKEKVREEERKRKKRKEKERKAEKKEKSDRGKKGAVTDSWGKYGIIRETDMWNKRPEFTAWLSEVKQINLESLPNWEEKQLFKDFMEDHNTATFPSKKYYNLDAYYKREMEKESKKGVKKVLQAERIVFNDEEQRRQELLMAREKQKEEEVEALKRSMQSGMAQAMKEQAQLREEMAYMYKIGNFEAAAAIQKRLDPDVAM
ncbi:vicilin-like seed storage protein At2g18540 [Hibiscus syriacus]|uniref:vicilin-like seed storage protein At2g18540 n=1 Tax=Hibiscus syriacus TaxID=106335 RepID=UPI001920F417|nr:vicilin-like seed storage protein At2g18540 [Hibiscus syriacus]